MFSDTLTVDVVVIDDVSFEVGTGDDGVEDNEDVSTRSISHSDE
jgi:hypothetical protein